MHITDEEIDRLIKPFRPYLGCKDCFERIKYVLYRERFLVEQGISKSKDVIKEKEETS